VTLVDDPSLARKTPSTHTVTTPESPAEETAICIVCDQEYAVCPTSLKGKECELVSPPGLTDKELASPPDEESEELLECPPDKELLAYSAGVIAYNFCWIVVNFPDVQRKTVIVQCQYCNHSESRYTEVISTSLESCKHVKHCNIYSSKLHLVDFVRQVSKIYSNKAMSLSFIYYLLKLTRYDFLNFHIF